MTCWSGKFNWRRLLFACLRSLPIRYGGSVIYRGISPEFSQPGSGIVLLPDRGQMEESNRLSSPVRFGLFEIEVQAGELRKQGFKVKLQEQPFQVLVMLLERPGEVVTRDELKRRLWPSDTYVDFEGGLNRAINKLREALGDDADSPRFIQTLPRRGYRFLAPVETASKRQNEEPGRVPVLAPPDMPGERSVSPGSTRPRRMMLWSFAGVVVLM